jgi:hypothetical protein
MLSLWERQSVRLAAVLAGVAGVAALATFAVAGYLRSDPPTVDFTKDKGPVNLTIQTVGTIGFGTHPTWVSYLVQDEQGNWIHSTLWRLPADRQISVTVYQFDSGGALRNSVWGAVTGTVGNQAVVNGKPDSLFDPSAGNGIAHTFNVPNLGINVPLYGIPSTAKNPCSAAPCATSFDHNTITFSFRTPKAAGQYRWQCFVPCGLSFLYGNGGPMSTVGYMGGFLKVVPA